MEIKRFDVFLVSFDPSVSSEIKKSRPAVIVSPAEMNRHLKTVIVAPLTSTIKKYPSRVEVNFENVQGEIALDRIRTVDKTRLIKRLAKIDERITERICEILTKMFSR